MMVEINCFHTCRNRGNKDEIIQKIQFLSNKDSTQWLGQGYYLWTDSIYFANDWGNSHYHSDYVINQFEVNVPKDLYWDLVGNVQHQLEFLEKKDQFYMLIDELIARSSIKNQPKFKLLRNRPITVATLFWLLRTLRKLTYKVVKASDISSNRTVEISFNNSDANECIFLPTRQQIVVYPEARSMLKHIAWVHP